MVVRPPSPQVSRHLLPKEKASPVLYSAPRRRSRSVYDPVVNNVGLWDVWGKTGKTEKGLLKIFFLCPDLIKGGIWHPEPPLSKPKKDEKCWLWQQPSLMLSHTLYCSPVNSAYMLSLCMQEVKMPCFCRAEELWQQRPHVSTFSQDMFIVTPLTAQQDKSLYKWEQNKYSRCATTVQMQIVQL